MLPEIKLTTRRFSNVESNVFASSNLLGSSRLSPQARIFGQAGSATPNGKIIGQRHFSTDKRITGNRGLSPLGSNSYSIESMQQHPSTSKLKSRKANYHPNDLKTIGEFAK